jgi:hypothetical protein
MPEYGWKFKRWESPCRSLGFACRVAAPLDILRQIRIETRLGKKPPRTTHGAYVLVKKFPKINGARLLDGTLVRARRIDIRVEIVALSGLQRGQGILELLPKDLETIVRRQEYIQ